MTDRTNPPKGISLSLDDASIDAQLHAADRFLRMHRGTQVLYGNMNPSEEQEHIFAAAWNRALQWIWEHPDIYARHQPR